MVAIAAVCCDSSSHAAVRGGPVARVPFCHANGEIKVSENRPPAPVEQRNEILDRVRRKGQASDSFHDRRFIIRAAVESDNSVFPHCVFGARPPVPGQPHAPGIYHNRMHIWVE